MSGQHVTRGRDGDLYPVVPDEHACRGGWLEPDPATGGPRPCPECKPHLRRRRGEVGMTGWTAKRNPHQP